MNKTKKNKNKRKNKRKAGSKKSSALKKITRQVRKNFEPCSICLERIPKKQRAQTVCGHFFHRKCINEWCMQKAREGEDCVCPKCREYLHDMTDLAQKKLEKENEKENERMEQEHRENQERIRRREEIFRTGRPVTPEESERRRLARLDGRIRPISYRELRRRARNQN